MNKLLIYNIELLFQAGIFPINEEQIAKCSLFYLCVFSTLFGIRICLDCYIEEFFAKSKSYTLNIIYEIVENCLFNHV